MRKALWQSSGKDRDLIQSLWAGATSGKKLRKMI
jgi:hypothetical protein